MSVHENRRHLMVECQLRTNKVTDVAVLEAFEDVPRENFMPAHLADLAYVDEDLDIGEGRFLLEPMVFARLVQALDLNKNDSVLDVGAASGYSTAVLSRICQSVVGLEKNEQLAETSQTTLQKEGVDNAVILHASLQNGFKAEAPYNAIIIEGSVEDVPESLLQQLSPDGRLVTVLRPDANGPGRAVKYVRAGKGFTHSVLFDANTPLLDDFATEKSFSFGA